MMFHRKSYLALLAAVIIGFGGSAPADAQKSDKKPATTKSKAKTAKAKKPTKKAAVKKAAPKKATAKTSAKPKKSKSACQGLTKGSCDRNKSCGWISPKKKTDKRGRKLKAYCRTVARASKAK